MIEAPQVIAQWVVHMFPWLAVHFVTFWEAAYRYAGPGIYERLTP